MRTKIVLSVVFFFMATFSLHAQTNFGFGLQKEIFGVSLNAENADDATFDVDKVELTMTMKDHFRIGLGVQMGTLVEHQAKRYEPGAGLSLSLTYLFPIKGYTDYAIAPTLSMGNSFKGFKSFKNIDADLGVRSYLFKAMYIGTGVRYAQWNNSDIVNGNNCFTWYWEMGFNLDFWNRANRIR
jgi:hypothetical protein